MGANFDKKLLIFGLASIHMLCSVFIPFLLLLLLFLKVFNLCQWSAVDWYVIMWCVQSFAIYNIDIGIHVIAFIKILWPKISKNKHMFRIYRFYFIIFIAIFVSNFFYYYYYLYVMLGDKILYWIIWICCCLFFLFQFKMLYCS